MASTIRSNRLIPILGGVVAVLLLIVILVGGDEDSPEPATVSHPDELAPGEEIDPADVDTQADTIRMLTAQNQQLEEQLKQLQEELNAVKDEEQDGGQDEEAQKRREQLLERIETLNQRVAEAEEEAKEAADETDLPVGLGLGSGEQPLGVGDQAPSQADSGPSPVTAEQLAWIDPVDTPRRADAQGEGDGLMQAEAGPAGEGWPEAEASQASETEAAGGAEGSEETEETEGDTAVYTVPRNSILMGSKTLTALIGRIPREGTVEDAAPFKVVVGSENLAANDIEIPGLEGMILSGHAYGDWTLSCVRPEIESATFVFEDGTTRTFPDPGDGTVRQAKADGGREVDAGARMGKGEAASPRIGYLSDPQGVPCIAGERISNASAYLTQASAIAAGQAASDALAQAETRTIVGQQGSTQTIIDGDIGRFIGGRAASGAAQEVLEWLRRRQKNHFDAIFTPAGQEVVVHINRELRIDYEPDGRRVSHDQRPDFQSSLSDQPFKRRGAARRDGLD